MFALFDEDVFPLHVDRRLRCLRQLNQRLWIFAAFGDAFLLWQATKSSAATLA